MQTRLYLIGHVGKDAETRTLETGAAVTSFPFATTATWKDKSGQKQERTTWYNCTIWNNEKIGQFLTKGKALTIESDSVSASAYNDKEGKPVGRLEVKVKDFTFLPSGAAAKTESPIEGVKQSAEGDDLPF